MKIKELRPGFFVMKISSQKNGESKDIGEWILSISNTEMPEIVDTKEVNLFIPSFLTVEAGIPFTFNAELSGTTNINIQNNEKELKIDAAVRIGDVKPNEIIKMKSISL
jgi:hypothetical protein